MAFQPILLAFVVCCLRDGKNSRKVRLTHLLNRRIVAHVILSVQHWLAIAAHLFWISNIRRKDVLFLLSIHLSLTDLLTMLFRWPWATFDRSLRSQLLIFTFILTNRVVDGCRQLFEIPLEGLWMRVYDVRLMREKWIYGVMLGHHFFMVDPALIGVLIFHKNGHLLVDLP